VKASSGVQVITLAIARKEIKIFFCYCLVFSERTCVKISEFLIVQRFVW